MKVSIRLLSAFLAMIVLLCCFAACGDKQDDPVDTEGEVTTAPDEATVETTDPNYTDELPEDLNFSNNSSREITIYAPGDDVHADEFIGDSGSMDVSYAVFQRNSSVEERLGVVITTRLEDKSASNDTAVNAQLEQNYAASLNEFQIVTSPTYVATKYVIRGHYANLKAVDHIDLEKYYWSQGFNNVYSYGEDQQYLATGSAAITLYRLMFVTIYNKQMFADFNQPDPYTLVKNGEWTLAKQHELAKVFYTEDGDNTIYGLSTGYKICVDPYWVSMDINLIDKNADNQFASFATNATVRQRLSDAVDLIREMYNDNCTTLIPYDQDGMSTETIKPFYEKRAAMATVMCWHIEKNLESLGEVESYAIVPMPKFNNEQDAYYTCLQDQVSAIGIPKTLPNGDLSMVGAVLECLASESHKTVVPEYYEKRLKVRYLNDPESSEMMQMIYEGARITMGASYTGIILQSANTGFSTMMRGLVATQSNVVASTLRQYIGNINDGIKVLNSSMAALP